MRLLTPRLLHALWRRRLPLPPAPAARRRGGGLLPYPCALPPCPSRTVTRPVFTGGSLRVTDVSQPEQTEQRTEEKLDLDIWKSVMRSQSQVPSEERLEEEGDDDDEDGVLPPATEEERCPLEATRELVAMWREAGKLVPENMTEEEVLALTRLATKSARKKYLKYLAIKEGHKKTRREKQEKKKAERASLEEERTRERDAEDDEGEGGTPTKLKNTFLLQFWSRSLDKLLGWRSCQAMAFGQPLVLDMSYEAHMGRRELENAVSQLMEVEGWNRRAAEPFHLHFCNLQPDGGYRRELLKRYGADAWDRLLVTATPRPHVETFPPERLVYLTADSPNVLRAFDHDKVYVVGALVDRSVQSGASLAVAKRLNLATARLPLDEFLHWEVGGKNLTLDQMVRILLTLKENGSWAEALEFVPKRKHDGFHPRLQPPPKKKKKEEEVPVARARSRGGYRAREGTDGGSGGHRSGDEGLVSGDGGGRTVRAGDRDRRPPNARKDTAFARDGGRGDHRPPPPPPWTGDESKLPARLRTSLRSKMEEAGRDGGRPGKSRKNWWDEE